MVAIWFISGKYYKEKFYAYKKLEILNFRHNCFHNLKLIFKICNSLLSNFIPVWTKEFCINLLHERYNLIKP